MHFSFAVPAPVQPVSQSDPSTQVPANALELLRQILEVQQEQLALSRAVAAANDGGNRWRNFLARWNEDFPDLAGSCKQVLPQLERAYMEMMLELTDKLQDDDDTLVNEFNLAEFLDRYGMKLGQLGTILNLVTPLADAYVPPQPATAAEENSGES